MINLSGEYARSISESGSRVNVMDTSWEKTFRPDNMNSSFFFFRFVGVF